MKTTLKVFIFIIVVLVLCHTNPSSVFFRESAYYRYGESFSEKKDDQKNVSENISLARYYLQQIYKRRDFKEEEASFDANSVLKFSLGEEVFTVKIDNKKLYQITRTQDFREWNPSDSDVKNAIALSGNILKKMMPEENFVYEDSSKLESSIGILFHLQKGEFRTHNHIFLEIYKNQVIRYMNETKYYEQFSETGEAKRISEMEAKKEALRLFKLTLSEVSILRKLSFNFSHSFLSKASLEDCYYSNLMYILCKIRRREELIAPFLAWKQLPSSHLKNIWVFFFKEEYIRIEIWIDANSGKFVGGKLYDLPLGEIWPKY